MLKSTALCLIALLASAMSAVARIPDSTAASPHNKPQSVGLVLSGGGAKGIAHIGVIQALEDNDIPIDYITGTSMGAIIGGLYACGYTPDEMMQVIGSKSFSYWSTGQIDPSLTYYYSRPTPTPALATINLAKSDSTGHSASFMPASLISPLPMNFGFMEIFAPYTAQCGEDFNRLFVPFRCVASDVTHKHKLVMGSGSVGDAIRASMNFPIVFHPIEHNGALLYDGGIYENYPIATMSSVFAPDFMIGVDVSSTDEKPSPNEGIIDQLETLIIQNGTSKMPSDRGINMRIHLEQFGLLDFNAARDIYNIGYDYAMQQIDSIKSRVTSRISPQSRKLRREVFKSKTPPLRFDTVTVCGASDSQNNLLASMFRPRKGCDTIGVSQARDAYYRAITPGKLKNFIPQAIYNDTSGLFQLNLTASVKDNFNVGIGGYVSSSTSSMLFFSGAYRTLSHNALDLTLNAWAGQSYMAAQASATMALRTVHPSSLRFQAVGSRHKYYQSDHLFFEKNQPTFLSSDELFAQLSFLTALTRNSKGELTIGAAHNINRYYSDIASEFATGHRDHLTQNLAQALVRIESSTLDNMQYPTSGTFYHLTAMGVTGRYSHKPAERESAQQWSDNRTFAQIEFRSRNFWRLAKHFALGIETDILASTRHLFADYYSSIVDAPTFNPTASSYATFDPDFRAYSFASAGVVPVWRISDMLQLRGSFYSFFAARQILELPDGSAAHSRWFPNAHFLGEVAGVVTLPFATVSAYGRYSSTPAGRWNAGISFGLFFLAPRFLR